MKYIDEFRDTERAKGIIKTLREEASKIKRSVHIMEICGGHTVAICRYGIRQLLPENITLVSGPGCPVCVTPKRVVDAAMWLVQEKGVTLFTFGDMLRVPGSRGSLREMTSHGRVKMMYSPLHAVQYAEEHPAETIVLFGVGFETTAPTLAAAILQAEEKGLSNFYFLSAGKRTPPAMRALLDAGETPLDAFIAPGHVTTVTGAEEYQFLEKDYGVPCVIAGFELCDILDSLRRICSQLAREEHHIEIEYGRSVRMEGNKKAKSAINRVFQHVDTEWRGLGVVTESGYALREPFIVRDAWQHFSPQVETVDDPPGCRCGDVLRGICTPQECRLFGKACKPDTPIGPCMVSSEGSCGAYYTYCSADI